MKISQVKAGTIFYQVMISQGFLPTSLTAAGDAPDPAYPSDGMNWLPILSENVTSLYSDRY